MNLHLTISKTRHWEKGIKKALNCFKACGDEWARTTDSRIFSPMLYQLSYITAESDAKVGICYFCTSNLIKKIMEIY